MMTQIPFWVWPTALAGTLIFFGIIWALLKVSTVTPEEQAYFKADEYHPCVQESLLNIR